ncbi:MAG: ribosome silencing factor [Planctomycetota bacterium]|nr:ribosome silencing factor [Planctomycetota bacterium]
MHESERNRTSASSAGDPASRPLGPGGVELSRGLPVRSPAASVIPTDDPQRAAQAQKFAMDAARTLEENKCTDVVVLDLRGRSPITDFLVIGSGTSDRQLHSAADHVVETAQASNMSLYRSNIDEPRSPWIILDFVDVVAHVFMPEARAYYDLEMLWGDAPRLKMGDETVEQAEAGSRNRAGLRPGEILPGRGGAG